MVEPSINVESVKLASIATIAVSIAIGIAGVILLAAARRRRCFIVFTALSGVPLIVGAIGMAIGYSDVGEALASAGEVQFDPSVIQAAFAQARMPLYIGAAGFGALLLLSFVGMLLCRDLCEKKELESTELVS